jgi:hypothetical protein
MATISIALITLASFAVQGLVTFAIVYFSARLAIRHERRTSN